MKILFNCHNLKEIKDISLLQRVLTIIQQTLTRFFKHCTKDERALKSWFLKIPLEIHFSRRMGRNMLANATYICKNGIAKNIVQIKCLKLTISRTASKNSKKKFRDIIIHEIAHLIDYLIRFNSFHDEPWRRLCHLMGGTGDIRI